ncbi:uncharacterized protein AB675_2549 [Cyphellophora attinorum]|uniref:Uncharacterized protein n=1 Tax=Cyphellophora attinorum TaxID=1664694 RepID=A0A0N1HH16_9EURO|nr:uncharacterized protein AB675_2549 [Phialophora attinorum]KPI45153.1 hypothetical protein AB675_2549 [Phialophora attinorum]
MPVTTRRAGPPAGGYQELPEVTRKRKVIPTFYIPPPSTPEPASPEPASPVTAYPEQPLSEPASSPSQFVPSSPTPAPISPEASRLRRLASLIVNVVRTNTPQAVRTPKRPLEDDSDDEHRPKRINSESRASILKFDPFDPNRKRSAIIDPKTPISRRLASIRSTQSARQPTRKGEQTRMLLNQLGPKTPLVQTPAQPEPSPVSTPSRQGILGTIAGSVTRTFRRTFFGGGSDTAQQSPAGSTIEPNPFENNNVPKAATRTNRPPSKSRRTKPQTSNQQPSVEDSAEEGEEFQTIQIVGTNKRKMDDQDAPPVKKQRMLNADEFGNPTGRYGLQDDWLEIDDEDDEEVATPEESEEPRAAEPENSYKDLEHFQPSSLKRKGILKAAGNAPVNGQNTKKVGFGQNEVKTYYNNSFGPAGIYTGTLFRDDKDPVMTPQTNAFNNDSTPSTHGSAGYTPGPHYLHEVGGAFIADSPTTVDNTRTNVVEQHWAARGADQEEKQSYQHKVDALENAAKKKEKAERQKLAFQQAAYNEMRGIKPTYKGTKEYTNGNINKNINQNTNPSGRFQAPEPEDDDDSVLQEEEPEVTQIPNAPKISHAALPGSNDRLTKARQEAQQYKPKQASRLSQVSAARSRSSSPPPPEAGGTQQLSDEETMREAEEWAKGLTWPEPNTYEESARNRAERQAAFEAEDAQQQQEVEQHEETPEERAKRLDDEQQMREADEWAKSIKWPKLKTYVEAGLCSEYIDNLIRSRWTEDDSRIAHEFWSKEFDEVDRMMNAAKAEGKELELLYE